MPDKRKSKTHRQEQAAAIFLRGQEQQDLGNTRSGFSLLLTAAKLGNADAQFNLAYTYDSGIGIRQNRTAAKFWYKEAYRTQRGWGIAASNLGIIFRDEGDRSRAIRWFRRAVHHGDVDANLDLAKIYLANSRNMNKAIGCLTEILKATPPIGVSDDAQTEAKKLLQNISRE